MDETAVKPGMPVRAVDATAIQAQAPAPSAGAKGAAMATERNAPEPLWKQILEPISSLKLTVILFALSLVIVFYGTWAQVDQGIWYVVSQYFRSYFVWIPLKVILFHSIDSSPFSIPFPGGWTLGALLLTNLVAAHAVRFKMTWRRSGIFILHAGLIIMMVSEFITGLWATEGIMQIAEGQAANYTQDAHNAELAIIDISDPKNDDTVAIPHRVLKRDGTISHEKLPFNIELIEYMANSVEGRIDAAAKDNKATAGFGKDAVLRPAAQVSGADPEQKYDQPAAYVKLLDKATGQPIDTYAVRMFWKEQKLKVGDKTYEIALRPKRNYKPFSVYLEKASYKTYAGTEKAKDYSSYVKIKDENGEPLREARIYMNHPLYFGGETYFQSSMEVRRPPIITGLQVVYNPAMGMPLLSLCMVGVGMLIHFGIHLFEFLQRRMVT